MPGEAHSWSLRRWRERSQQKNPWCYTQARPCPAGLTCAIFSFRPPGDLGRTTALSCRAGLQGPPPGLNVILRTDAIRVDSAAISDENVLCTFTAGFVQLPQPIRS